MVRRVVADENGTFSLAAGVGRMLPPEAVAIHPLPHQMKAATIASRALIRRIGRVL